MAMTLQVCPGVAPVIAFIGNVGMIIIVGMVKTASQTIVETLYLYTAGFVRNLNPVQRTFLGKDVAKRETVIIKAEKN